MFSRSDKKFFFKEILSKSEVVLRSPTTFYLHNVFKPQTQKFSKRERCFTCSRTKNTTNDTLLQAFSCNDSWLLLKVMAIRNVKDQKS